MPPTSSSYHLPTTLAFLAGILLTLGFKDFYPDLERRFRRRWSSSSNILSSGNRVEIADEVAAEHTDGGKSGRSGNGGAKGAERESSGVPGYGIGEGIESTIGNTPLFRIKSLSEETGCEILGKAEVSQPFIYYLMFIRFLRPASRMPRSDVAILPECSG
ncbi:hypothetical protein MMC19_001974 [Ptychographa xylographoides]|nr:hypothetical protein [Ptychographa xylographoides]